ncbi:MAG: pectate lyase [Robiginitomaculum sp.]|nr:MAG: pectate lyase [Robiginitomaculum sp.]
MSSAIFLKSRVSLALLTGVSLLYMSGCQAPEAGGNESVASAATSNSEAQSLDTVYFGNSIWQGSIKGGAGGQILRVTNLNADGPGSLREAIDTKGPRTIVFEVGGVIDLGKATLSISEPNITIAGQTAPSPGITIIRGGFDIRANQVIVQHLRIRPGDVGEAPASGWGEDAISTRSASFIAVDHCSLSWATDENLSASGPRFTGTTLEDWQAGTSHDIVFSNNIISEGLALSTHPKIEHSKGSLIHDNVTNILIYANLYAHNEERSPLFKGGVHGAIVNNLIYNPGERAIHYNLQGLEWGDTPFADGYMSVIGNVLRGGLDTAENLPLVLVGGEGDLNLYESDNIAVDKFGNDLPKLARYTTGVARTITTNTQSQALPDGLKLYPSHVVERHVLKNAGARPWDRDKNDVRVLADTAEGRGWIIDSQEDVGGYPVMRETHKPFDPDAWNLDTMEPKTQDALDSSRQSQGT